MTSSLSTLATCRTAESVITELHTVPTAQVGCSHLLAQLRHRIEVQVVERDDPRATVALVVADGVDETTLRTVRRLHRERGLSVVLIIGILEPHSLLSIVEAGVCAALPRADATAERVVRAVQAAARRHGARPAQVLAHRVDARPRPHGTDPRTLTSAGRAVRPAAPLGLSESGLSRRERAVLELVADGRSTREIALTLNYSERTIKNVLQDLTTRLQLRNRTQAVAYALRNGWI